MFFPEPGGIYKFVPANGTNNHEKRDHRQDKPLLLIGKRRVKYKKKKHGQEKDHELLPLPENPEKQEEAYGRYQQSEDG